MSASLVGSEMCIRDRLSLGAVVASALCRSRKGTGVTKMCGRVRVCARARVRVRARASACAPAKVCARECA
eukprot:14157703-Alexandrium_andersonii.AAC.1